MKITIIANFTIDGSLSSRFIELAQKFADNGHEVSVLTSDFSHGKKTHLETFVRYSNFEIEYIHEPGYPSNVGIKRLYSHWRWGLNVEKYLSQHDIPDVVYCAIPSLTAGAIAASFCKKNKIKFVVDIQDLWPEAFMLVIKNKILQLGFKPMEWLANQSYSHSDLVVGVSDTYRDRGLKVNKKGKRGLTVYLGNHLDLFDHSKHQFSADKHVNEFWVAYIGTIGYSYDIPCVIDGIAKYNSKIDNLKKVRLIAMGNGPFIKQFTDYSKHKKVAADFTGGLSYEKMVGMMCSCDIVVNPIRKGAAQSITNKVGDYAFSGLAVINTQECQEYRDLVDKYQCGINCECGNSNQVAEAIERLITQPWLCKQMGMGARKLGEERFDRNNTYPLIIDAVEKLI